MVDRATARAVTAYRDKLEAIRGRVVAAVDRTWQRLGDYRPADIARFAGAAAPVVAGGQAQTAALTAGYLALVQTAVLGAGAGPVGIPRSVIAAEAIRGVPILEVYRRPGIAVWAALSRGVAFGDAVNVGRSRALGLAATDLQLAKTHAARYVGDRSDRITGYRRLVESGKPCGLCIGAADQVYGSGDLMPIHPNCGCDVEPIFDTRHPDPPDVDQADAEDVTVHDHGELGPVLVAAGAGFTGPDDL